MNKILNKYYIKARLLPAILTSVPLISFYYYILKPLIGNNLNEIIPLIPHFGDISITIAAMLFLIQVNRFLSKEFLQRNYFNDELKMPTTDFLLHSNLEYSDDFKKIIREKIFNKYNIKLSDMIEEGADEQTARKKIKEAVGLIRVTLQGNEMLLNHNIEYGALRNLLGGCFHSIIFSIGLIIFKYFEPTKPPNLSYPIILFVIYTLLLIFSKWLMKRYGDNYAKILFQEFSHIK